MTVTINGTGTGCFTDASGNVGIGTATPTARLQATTATAAANFRFDGNNFAGGNYYGSSVNTTGVFTGLDSAGNFAINVRDAGALTVSTTNTERMRVDSSGNVGIGISDPSNYGSLAVYAGGTATSRQVIISPNSNSYNGMLSFLRVGTTVWNAGIDQADSNKFKIANSGAYSLSSGTVLTVDGSGNFSFNSGYGSVATAYGCRAWLNYNLSTQTTRASANVSSVTFNSTGYFTINFTSAMPDANYAIAGMGEWTSGTTSQTYPFVRNTTPPTTANCPIVVSSNGFQNPTWLMIQIVR